MMACAAVLVAPATCMINSANAGTITGTLLNQAGAANLEGWLGQGDLDWNSIWYGETGATATSWHNAVDGVVGTVSIYSVTHGGQDYLIGGYNSRSWGGSGYVHQPELESFIFNLTNPNKLQLLGAGENFFGRDGSHAIYNRSDYFATFGGGHDLYGGRNNIGSGGGHAHYLGSYAGDSSVYGNVLTNNETLQSFRVNALETYTFSVSQVPEPGTLAIFGTICLVGMVRRRQS